MLLNQLIREVIKFAFEISRLNFIFGLCLSMRFSQLQFVSSTSTALFSTILITATCKPSVACRENVIATAVVVVVPTLVVVLLLVVAVVDFICGSIL